MVQKIVRSGWVILAAFSLVPTLSAQVKTAYQLLPDTTQAVVRVADSDELAGRWGRTQLAKLAEDDAIKPFWDDQRQEIEKRFLDAGWRLNIKPQDLASIAGGQLSIAWIERSEPTKPYGLALIVDLIEDRTAVDKLMGRLDVELIARTAKKRSFDFEGETINQYTLTRVGELLNQETFYAIVGRQLMSSDNEELIKDMLLRSKGKAASENALESETAFVTARALLKPTDQAQVEYFVRPIGFAKVLKAIGGKRRGGTTDILAVLSNQGFSAIKGICGELEFGATDFDMKHRGFVYADKPLPKSAAILDFPNNAKPEIPSFVGEKVSTLLVGYWNSQQAFWKIEGLVDEMAGQPGVFMEVIKGIKSDDAGPKIDIKEQVLPYLTNEIYSISDTVDPITTDSHRNLIALRLKSPEKLKAVLRQAMKNEPGAELVEGTDEIWRKSNNTDAAADLALNEDFGDFGATPAPQAQPAQNPWLSSWAITVHGDYFMFASHVDMIKEAIAQSKAAKDSPLASEPTSQRMRAALVKNFGDQPNCFWQIVRSDLSYRMQYELFRTGQLDQSQSMLASLLDRLLQNNAEIKAAAPKKINGGRLPKFEEISHYLQPSGMVVREKEKGWEFGSMLLASPDVNNSTNEGLSGLPASRVSNTENGEKR